MHFHSLAVLRIPEIQEDAEENARIEKELAEMEQMEDQGPQNIMRSIMIRELRGLLNSFSREVFRLIQDLMHPYGSESEDCYEFIDQKSDASLVMKTGPVTVYAFRMDESSASMTVVCGVSS